jgi:hypothetical protein
MTDPVKPLKRGYHAPQRAAAAARTREAVVTAAKDAFERLGWSGATMRGTKAELLKQAIDFAIAGDLRPIPVLGRESVAAMLAAPDAPAMLDLHARHARSISQRAAPILWVAEQAAPADRETARLWAQNNDQRRAGAAWAADTLLSKPGVPPHISRRYAEEVFWIAIDPATYRSLTLGRGLSPSGFETWISGFYRNMLLR